MISWVVMLVSRLLDYVASIEDEASGGKKHLGGKERERPVTGKIPAFYISLICVNVFCFFLNFLFLFLIYRHWKL